MRPFQARHSLPSMFRLFLEAHQLLLEGKNLQQYTDDFNEAADAMDLKWKSLEQFVPTRLLPQNEGVYDQHTGPIPLMPEPFKGNNGMLFTRNDLIKRILFRDRATKLWAQLLENVHQKQLLTWSGGWLQWC